MNPEHTTTVSARLIVKVADGKGHRANIVNNVNIAEISPKLQKEVDRMTTAMKAALVLDKRTVSQWREVMANVGKPFVGAVASIIWWDFAEQGDTEEWDQFKADFADTYNKDYDPANEPLCEELKKVGYTDPKTRVGCKDDTSRRRMRDARGAGMTLRLACSKCEG